MQKKKIVAGITAIVVLALLFAGVGYAFSGSARTYNQGDEQTLAYMSVTPADFKPIFTDAITHKTIFDTYAYEDADPTDPALIAYAFDVDEENVVDITANEVAYKAVKLGEKNMTVLNNTGEALTALKFTVTATGNVGNSDFVFIFELQNLDNYVTKNVWADGTTYYTYDEEEKIFTQSTINNKTDFDTAVTGGTIFYIKDPNASYIVYTGTNSGFANVASTYLFDTKENNVKVTVYVGYQTNVYVPNNYIGPASADEKHQSVYWTPGVTYYTDSACQTEANPQPANQAAIDTAIAAENPYYEKWLPYRQTTTAPIDLATTAFAIEVTDANA